MKCDQSMPQMGQLNSNVIRKISQHVRKREREREKEGRKEGKDEVFYEYI